MLQVGVLTRHILDDGRGFARSKVFKHGHEEATGRTSSIGQHNLCVSSMSWPPGCLTHTLASAPLTACPSCTTSFLVTLHLRGCKLSEYCSAQSPHRCYQNKTRICSSACVQLDSKCNILNDQMFRSNSSAEYIARASKVVTLVDLAGHERYFKTTAYGLTGHMPDYACLIVGANAGQLTVVPSVRLTWQSMSRHARSALALIYVH